MFIPYDYNKIDGHYVPKVIVFRDANKGAMIKGKFVNEQTVVTISDVSFANLPDSTFSKTFLQQVSQ
jgi:ribosomal protein L35AE/L33A